MINNLRLIVAGLLVAGLSLGTWSVTQPSETAGSALAFEVALTSPPAELGARTVEEVEVPFPDASTDDGASSLVDSPEIDSSEAAPTTPRFTVGQTAEVADRTPVSLRIPALGEEAPIILAGVEDNGEMEIPDNVTDVAWYKYGPTPGEAGSAVLAAHVDLAGQGPGVFFELGTLEPGSLILVDYDDGTTGSFRAEARAVYEKSELPTEAIFSRQGPPVLTLITCGGDFNRSLGSYESNIVVYAVPVESDGIDAA